jgi:hypothetical protein
MNLKMNLSPQNKKPKDYSRKGMNLKRGLSGLSIAAKEKIDGLA